jgi:Family of unknown function (DUF5675)
VNLLLPRDNDDGDRTFGLLEVYEAAIRDAALLTLQTLERPWVPAPDGVPGGHPMISCVPAGEYQLVLHDTPQHPQTWALVNPALGVYHELADIPPGESGRVACLIHSANLVEQLAGCISVGLARSEMDNEPDVSDSREAFAQLKAAVPWTNGHTLTIVGGGQG